VPLPLPVSVTVAERLTEPLLLAVGELVPLPEMEPLMELLTVAQLDSVAVELALPEGERVGLPRPVALALPVLTLL